MPRLMEYPFVPPGFEMVLGEEQGEAGVAPGSGGGCWGMWFNVSLSDDPTAWDDEVERLNQLQKTLPSLSEDQRLVRAQMAEFCRYHPLFPGSVETIIRNVGAGRLMDASNIGCEGRRLLVTLGVHTEEALRDQGRRVALSTSDALRKALRGEKPDDPAEKKYHSLAGRLGDAERRSAGWLADVLARGMPEAASFRELCEAHGRKHSDFDELEGRPYSCLGCVEGSGQCCFTQQMEATLLCLSGGDAEARGRRLNRFREEYVLAYCDAVNSWLGDRPPLNPWPDIEALYVGEDEATDIAQRVEASLGGKTPEKVWLAGCLLKTLKSNQRWRSRGELLDGFLGAASWLE
ncbi:hypothetical protein JXL21_04570 [Candidatus Bathyarchaeota archaeon]|nr:hypothetical protein [Candidatus Bathyarchaeota archaeon]